MSLGRYDHAEALTEASERATSFDDPDVHIRCRINRARIERQHGHHGRAEEFAMDACARADMTDWLNLRGRARLCLGDVHVAHGRKENAAREFEQAQELFEQKENVLFASIASRRAQGRS